MSERESDRHTVLLAPPARRALASGLPEAVAAAAWELITGALARDPWRVGKPLSEPYEGLHVARRGTYRVVYRIDDDKYTVTVLTVKHRRDAYRP
ncbi:type II toxin-antitoxin system RelE family toxin [Sphaerisporangium corydalis]|uniref:Type II toxin-antitoxin system RelE/ParE family toxin n=1 Tax=Sphaerisporangium corydalis TaxID=1441875 RepID=A0ABV9E8Q9_9ACTN|nr:type II toxin-antitoxin system RelE/ParE family toxin [Sphaerisporangium corydalis]